MKPWEETWSRIGSYIETGPPLHNPVAIFDCQESGDGCDVCFRRTALAAAAPEMARLLLNSGLECEDGYLSNDRCFACHVLADSHAPDCRLVAVLRKAGVKE